MFGTFCISCWPQEVFCIRHKVKPTATRNEEVNRPMWLEFSGIKSISKLITSKGLDTDSDNTLDGTQEIDEVMAQSVASDTTTALQLQSHHIHINTAWLKFPFLEDEATISFVKHSKVLFLIRGLSGSGKSTLVRQIASVYPNNVVCSADDYYMQDGKYMYDHSKLDVAHQSCKDKVLKACTDNVNVVVVDNTHIRYWEAKNYFEIASKYSYIVIVATPNTPWAKDAQELCKRNKHGVDLITIKRKLETFEEYIPFYYAWFVNEQLSQRLMSMGKSLFKECLQLYPELKNNLQELFEKYESGGDFPNDYFGSEQKRHILHCTSKYVGKGREDGGKEYHDRSDVKLAYSRVFTITLFGFTITEKTLGARIHLPPEALQLFDKPEERQHDGIKSTENRSPVKKSPIKSPVSPSKQSKSCSNSDIGVDELMIRGLSISPTSESATFGDKFGCASASTSASTPAISEFYKLVRPRSRGRSAHMTLGTANKIHSKQTTIDLLDICDIEKSAKISEGNFKTVSEGRSICYDKNHCCVYLDKPYNISVIFTGSY